jgi:hypothetical protein
MNKTQTKKENRPNQLIFDTHKAVKNIAEKGIKAQAAEVIVKTMQEVSTASHHDLVTQKDLQEFKHATQKDMIDFKHEMQQKMGDFKH